MTGKRKFWLCVFSMACVTMGNMTGNIPGDKAAWAIVGVVTAITGGYAVEYWKKK